MVKKTALLIDISSIQEYVFGSNMLKMNIGASHIIELEIWNTGKNNISIEHETVYIGGGNALFKFSDQTKAKSFINAFSRNVLLSFPGLKLSAAIINDYDNSNSEAFRASRKRLSLQMIKNKSLHPAHPFLPKEGIFSDCVETNEYQEVKSETKNGGIVSKVAAAKIRGCNVAQKDINASIEKLTPEFIFTDELDKLGQIKDKGYIAVVHIDGNNIGQRFINCQSEEELKQLSGKVSQIAKDTMTELTNHVCTIFSTDKGVVKEIDLDTEGKKESQKQILPFRPILNGGDDITFVTEGRLGVYLAQEFIKQFEKIANTVLPSNESEKEIKACAGIAIVKTKFPFFKAYQLAEELCHEAKKLSRTNPGSYLSFHVANQGISGDLYTVRKAELMCQHGSLTANPYAVSGNHPNTLTSLLEISGHLHHKWPRNKLMELRETVKKSDGTQKLFKKQIEYRKHKMPAAPLWDNNVTKYWDALQMIQFFPKCYLPKPTKNDKDDKV